MNGRSAGWHRGKAAGLCGGPLRIRGFSLIEVITFVLIIGIVAAGLLTSFNGALRDTHQPSQLEMAMLLAQERMELIIGRRRNLGFGSFTASNFDPCTASPSSNLSFCNSIPAGYTVTSTLSDNWAGDTNYKTITVDVSGPANATVEALVASY